MGLHFYLLLPYIATISRLEIFLKIFMLIYPCKATCNFVLKVAVQYKENIILDKVRVRNRARHVVMMVWIRV